MNNRFFFHTPHFEHTAANYFAQAKKYHHQQQFIKALLSYIKAWGIDSISGGLDYEDLYEIEKFFKGIKKYELFNYIKTFPIERQIDLLYIGINKNLDHPLSRHFWRQKGFLACSLAKGTLQEICHYLESIDPHFSNKITKLTSTHPSLPPQRLNEYSPRENAIELYNKF